MATPTGTPPEKNYLPLLIVAVLLLVLGIAGLFVHQSRSVGGAGQLNASSTVVDTIDALGKTAEDTANGVTPDFDLTKRQTEIVGTLLAAFESGNSALGFPALPSAADADLERLRAAWAPMQGALKSFDDNALSYGRVAINIKAIGDVVPPAIGAYGEQLDRSARAGSAADNYALSRQLQRLNRVVYLARQTLSNGREAEGTAQALGTEVAEFQREHRALSASGTVERVTAKYVSDALATVETATVALTQDIKPAAAVQAAATSLAAAQPAALSAAENLRRTLQGGAGLSKSLLIASILGLVAGLGLITLYITLSLRDRQQRDRIAARHDEAQQQSILSLLDEITNIANGDLTGELTVTTDFTGNIADSLNFTVQTLRGLVGTINDTSVEIAAAASSTTERVQQMSTSSEGQAREIVRATQAISYGSRSLDDVASRAEKLADQAKGSVDTAHSGAETVKKTITGMTTLREQIQDTAKRIKRLGESSQEIGNIIEFINDIAEQTNTLALNASIQAAMAGESGRGFAVVADEVQRLAERAASATKQIENLVKTIQADTQEAITSMERSTTNVVGGAKSAEEAGLALNRIEASSQELAKVIQDIASASRAQSVETTKLASTMQGIREISVQTSSNAHQTAESVGELNVLSAKLRESVAGFKLPTEVSSFGPA